MSFIRSPWRFLAFKLSFHFTKCKIIVLKLNRASLVTCLSLNQLLRLIFKFFEKIGENVGAQKRKNTSKIIFFCFCFRNSSRKTLHSSQRDPLVLCCWLSVLSRPLTNKVFEIHKGSFINDVKKFLTFLGPLFIA